MSSDRTIHLDPRGFAITTSPDPHVRRRREILRAHPEVTRLFGYDRRTSAITSAVVAAQLGIAYVLGDQARRGGVLGSCWVVTTIAFLVGSVLAHWAAVAIHEA